MSDDTPASGPWGGPGRRPGAPEAEEQLSQQGVTPPRRPMTVQGVQTWVDQSIQQAQRQGAFDNLQGAGRPLKDVDTDSDPDWWVKGLIEREKLDMSDAMPGVMQLRREKSRLPGSLLLMDDEAAVRAHLEDFNARVLADRRRPYGGAQSPPIVGRVDVEELVVQWRAGRTERMRAAAAAAAADKAEGEGRPQASRGRWWRRRR